MPFVPVPKDLSNVKTKVALNLTKRQLICFSLAAAVGVPVYLFSRNSIGNDFALFLMIGLMLPFFFLAMYEKDSMPAEIVLRNIIRVKFILPGKRPYKTNNLYSYLIREGRKFDELEAKKANTAKKSFGSRKAKSKTK